MIKNNKINGFEHSVYNCDAELQCPLMSETEGVGGGGGMSHAAPLGDSGENTGTISR